MTTTYYKQYLQRRRVDPTTWVKESHAPSIMKVNSSSSSSAFSDPFEMIEISMINSTPNIEPYYGFWGDSRGQVCEDVRSWIFDTINESSEEEESEEEYKVETMKALPEAMTCNSLWTKGRKIPDVLLEIRRLGFVQFEIDSGCDSTTIFKLVIGLSDQNRYTRNFDTAITTTSEFYFPVGPGVPQRVDVSWNDNLLIYEAKCRQLVEADLDTELRDVVQNVEGQLNAFNGSRTSFTVPMMETFIKNKFAADAYQLCSGASVVVAVPSECKVYKRPLQASARETLCARVALGELNFTALPLNRPSSRNEYFVYNQYFPPLK